MANVARRKPRPLSTQSTPRQVGHSLEGRPIQTGVTFVFSSGRTRTCDRKRFAARMIALPESD